MVFPSSTERPLCATWQASLSFLSTHTAKKKKPKSKNSINKPPRSGLFCFGIYEHIPSSGWMRNRETSLWNVQAPPGQMGPFEIYDPASRLTHPLYTTLGETGTRFPKVRGGAAFPYLRKNAKTGQFQENELLGGGGPGKLVTMTTGSPSWATGPPAPNKSSESLYRCYRTKLLCTPQNPHLSTELLQNPGRGCRETGACWDLSSSERCKGAGQHNSQPGRETRG